ncbi:MAG: recombination mediator RecR [Spirochaetia bacterium]|jgi:recombination protein RecR|nr:recombination mediator RecR [Spirochaetia bacterium]
MTIIDQLIHGFSRLPGVGKKSAGRIVYFLLKADTDYLNTLADLIKRLKPSIRTCGVCGTYTESELCNICSDSGRDSEHICVVEESKDVQTIESTGVFNGTYHVLGGVISPIDGVGPEDLFIRKLLARLTPNFSEVEVKEVIIATNPTIEGDTTALYLVNLLKNTDITISRLALGLPVGGDLEYADKLTLSRSLNGRTKLS